MELTREQWLEVAATGTYEGETVDQQIHRLSEGRLLWVQGLKTRTKRYGQWHTIVRDANGKILAYVPETN